MSIDVIVYAILNVVRAQPQDAPHSEVGGPGYMVDIRVPSYLWPAPRLRQAAAPPCAELLKPGNWGHPCSHPSHTPAASGPLTVSWCHLPVRAV